MSKDPFQIKVDAQPSAVVRRYLHRRRTRGKSAVARILDAVMLLAVVFAAVWLYLCGKGVRPRHALLPAGIAVLFAAVLYRLYANWAMQRFFPREIERLSREILRQRLPFLEHSRYFDLCCKASDCKSPVVLRTAEPVGADTLLPYLRDAEAESRVFCACAGFTETAQKLTAGREPSVKLIGAAPLLDAAMKETSLRPSMEEVYRKIETEEAERRARSRRARAFPSGGGSRNYLIAAGLLFLFSFWTGYTLYYRMLAGLCLSMAVLRAYLSKDTHTTGIG